MKNRPNYKNIFNDIIDIKYPHKNNECKIILNKEELSISDILKLNSIIFGSNNIENQKFKSYDRKYIFEILDYQKKNKLNNHELAKLYSISRNTIAAWKKEYF